MALPDTGPKLLGELMTLLDKLPPGTIGLVTDLVRAVASSKDPVAAAKLATMAAAGKLGRHELANKLIKAGK